jgi:hypothetical protein
MTFDTLTIFTDNKAARAWAHPAGRLPKGSLAATRRAVEIRDYLTELSKFFSKIDVVHLPGTDNHALSRFFESFPPNTKDTEPADELPLVDDMDAEPEEDHGVMTTSIFTETDACSRFFVNCFTLVQHLNRLKSLIKIQRKYQFGPRNEPDTSF